MCKQCCESIFNKKITKKYNLWDRKQYTYALFTVDKVSELKRKKNVEKKKPQTCKPNGHLKT